MAHTLNISLSFITTSVSQCPAQTNSLSDWNKEPCPKAIKFPYSNLIIYWDNVNGEWYLNNVSAEQSPSMDKNPCSKCLSHITPTT